MTGKAFASLLNFSLSKKFYFLGKFLGKMLNLRRKFSILGILSSHNFF